MAKVESSNFSARTAADASRAAETPAGNPNAQRGKTKPTQAQLAELGARYLKIVQAGEDRPAVFTSLNMAMVDNAYMAQRPTLPRLPGGDLEAFVCQLKFLAAAAFEKDSDAPYTDEECYGGKLLFDDVIAAIEQYGDDVRTVLARVPAEAIRPDAAPGSSDRAEG